MKKIKTRILSLLLVLVSVLTLLPVPALAATTNGSGITPTTDPNLWSTRLTSTGASYSYRPPTAAGKQLYCMDLGYSYRYGTASFLNSYSYTSATGKDSDALWEQAVAKTGLSEMSASVKENAKWMMSYIADYTGDIPGSLFMALQTYIWDNQSNKSASGDASGDIDAGGFANADTYAEYVGYYEWLLGQKANEDRDLQAQVEAYEKQGIYASIEEIESSKWAVFASSSASGRQAFFVYHAKREVVAPPPGGGENPTPPTGGDEGVTLIKVDADTGRGLAGAQFKLEGISTSYQSTFTTGANGAVTITDLAAGSYKATEIVAPAGYVPDATPQTFYYYETTPVSLTFQDHSKTTVTLTKTTVGGAPLAGCTFNIYRDGQIIGSDTTDGAGRITVTGVVEGLYSFVETSAPDTFQVDPTPHEVYVDVADGSKEYTVSTTNAEKPDMEIVKLDAQTGDPIRGATFSVKSVTGTFSSAVTTGPDGKAALSALDAGVYVVQETSVPEPYVVSNTEQTVALQAGKTSVVTFTDYQKPGLEILKKDIATGNPIPNVSFKIEQIDGAYSTSATTDEKGRIFLENIPVGSYKVTETAVPEGVILGTIPQEVALKAGETSTVTFFNAAKPSLTVVKYDGNTGEYLPGATFRVAKIEDGSHYLDRITDTDGKFTIVDLDPGVYSVQEIQAPQGYVLNETEYHVELFNGQNSQLVVNNDAKPDLKIVKTDAITGEPLAGVTFKVKYADGSTITTEATDAKGEILLEDMDPGVYEIWENSVPDGYLLEKTPQLITLEPNQTGTVRFQNYPKPGLTIRKIDSITGDPIAGVKFHVTYASNDTFLGEINDLGTFYTDENGQIELTKLKDGWYRVTEVEPAAGYAIKDPATQECYIEAGRAKTLTFENTPLSALVVYKYDSVTGEAVAGAVFQVRYLSGTSGTGGTVIGTYKTSANGSFTVTGLKAGTYVVEELASDSGHVIDSAPQTAYLSGKEQDVVQLYFGNSPKGSLLIKKIDSVTHAPLSDVEFMVTASDGTVIGSANGKFTTDNAGSILISNLEPGLSVVVKEIRAKEGYVLDDTPQTVKIIAGETATLEFRNAPKGGLIVQKLDSVTKQPLPGAEFQITTSSGEFVGQSGGSITSNGLYTTDENGQIHIMEIKPGTYIVTETKAPAGYVLDTTSQTVQVNANDTQTLTFTNTPIGGLRIVKTDDASGKRIPGVRFEVAKQNGEKIGVYTTDNSGTIGLPELANGWYTVAELKAADGYILDATPQSVEVKDGQTAVVELTNHKQSGILIHKVDAHTGRGLYGAAFLLYDGNHNPIGQYTSDQDGYARITDELTDGKYYLRELEAPEGYLRDDSLKTFYVRYGATSEIRWENTAVTGQIQITKYAAEDNSVTGQAAGTALPGAVFEIVRYKSGVVVDYITSNARGVAVSDPLPLGRYLIREVTAPAYYQLDGQTFDVELEFAGQIVRLSAYNKCAELGVSITKTGNKEVLAGGSMTYNFKIANTSNTPLENFYWHDRLPTDAAVGMALVTGTYSQRLNYRVLYKTNYNDYRVLASNLLTTNNYSFALNALPLQGGEVVADIYFDFGTVPAGFQSKSKPMLTVAVSTKIANGYNLINRADVGGEYQGTWETATAGWVTIVRNLTPVARLPKTGY